MLTVKGRIALYGPLINFIVTVYCYLVGRSSGTFEQNGLITFEKIVSVTPEVYVFIIATFVGGTVISDCSLRMYRIIRRRLQSVSNSDNYFIQLFASPQTQLFCLVFWGSGSNLVLPLSMAFLVGPSHNHIWYYFCMSLYIIGAAIETIIVTLSLWIVHSRTKNDPTGSPTSMISLLAKSWIVTMYMLAVSAHLSSLLFSGNDESAGLSLYITLATMWIMKGSYCLELNRES
ncbi:hypothetical protein RCL1_009069 [Eukaryota sp. TZLM3-RCL]